MFKSARWRSEKIKIKVVFKLQFHVTRVPLSGVDALMISVVPGDVGKPTVRLEKATIQDGSCRWENPVYETVKFVREPQTGKINERMYHFIVSTGYSKAGFVGEVSIDFADYAEATKASTVSLPLKSSNSKAVLHVSIWRLQENVGQREMEASEDTKIKAQDRSLKAHLSNGGTDESITNNLTEDESFHKATSDVELNGNRRVSSGSDITMSSSEASSGVNTPRELGLRNNDNQHDSTNFLSSLRLTSISHKSTADNSTTIYDEHQISQWEWSEGSDHGVITDDSTNSSQDTISREGSQQDSAIEIEKLKAEIVILARQMDVSELELQTLRKQIVKESKKGQDLSREVVYLKEERDALKVECEKLKTSQKHKDESKVKDKLQFEGGDLLSSLEEIRQELNYEKDLNANLRLQLQKTQDSNTELILAVQDLDEMLEQKDKEIADLSNKTEYCEKAEEFGGIISRCDTDDDDEEQKALEDLVKEHRDAKETYLMEQQMIDLSSEIEFYRRDKDELEMQMEQLALDYEILKQENHDMSYKLEQSQLQEQLKIQYECSSSFPKINELESQIESLENELQKQTRELSGSLATINELETHIKSLEEEMEKQAQVFEADLETVTRAKVEQEQRAIQAEEALRKTRSKNVNTAERLQEEFRRLSMQMASTFDANEKVAMKALTEASELRMQKNQLEGMLQGASKELQSVRDDLEAKVLDFSRQIDFKTNQLEQMLLELETKSKQLEHLRKHNEEVSRNFSQEISDLKVEIERLTTENDLLSEQAEIAENLRAELEQMKVSVKEAEMMVERGNVEKDELVSSISLVKKEADKSLDELSRMRLLKDEKNTTVRHLQSELEMLKGQYNDLKHSLVEDELEKEKLRKKVIQLKSDLKKKEDALTSFEKKLKDCNGRATISDGTKTSQRSNKSAPVTHSSKEIPSLREKIKFLEGQIKLKEASLETSTNSFLEKENDLQNKIEELESRVQELNQYSTILCQNTFQKVAKENGDITSNDDISEQMRGTLEHPRNAACISEENGSSIPLAKSKDDNRDGKHNDFVIELTSLKEKNKSMETELKDMQERYSEISLKFAEVEGERQQLVMTVRNLKNNKKS